jgi:hypothetical protein
LNLRPIDYEGGGEPSEFLIRRIVRVFLDIDLRFEAVRAYPEPRLNFRPT